MIKSNRVGILIIGLFILTVGCENDPLELTPSNGQTLMRTVFMLSPESKAVQDSVLIGSSKTLYAGYIEDDKLSTILFSLDYDNLQEHPICLYLDEPDSLKDIENIQIEFKSLRSLMDADSNLFIDETALTIGLSLANPWSEDSDIADSDFSNFNWNIDTVLDSVTFSENSLQITIVDILQLLEWCNSQNQYLIINYEPELSTLPEDKLEVLEFYSSEFTISHQPQVSFDYSELKATEKSTNKYLVEEISSKLTELSVHIVNNIESEAWSRIYLLNLKDSDEYTDPDSIYLNESIYTTELDFNVEPVITSGMLEEEIQILTLTIELNEEIIDNIDTFGLSILDNSIIAYSNSNDLSGDEYDEDTNPEGTEDNKVFDEGEIYLDFGIDQCPDQYEDGIVGCLVLIDEFDSTDFNCVVPDDGTEVNTNCIYNAVGTEGNGTLDWEDSADEDGNFNGIWDEGEGEKWEDVGNDGCSDEFEDGDDTCLETQNADYAEGSDPNGDNYNIDPTGDDFDILENPNGTEDNGIWEEGEEFLDIGCDGIPQIIDVDGTQNDGIFQSSEDCLQSEVYESGIGEYLFDSGIDNCPDIWETGNLEAPCDSTLVESTYSLNGTEGNLSYDGGDELFYDFGVDNIEDGIDGDDPSDNFNIDPNGDNEDGDGNGIIDWADTNDDGLFNNDEIGEYFYDFGSDGVINADEVFSESNLLNIGTGTNEGLNDYSISKFSTDSTGYDMPNIYTDDAVIWISNVKPTTENKIELTFSIYATQDIKSLSFSLTHTKLDWVDTTFVSQSFSSNDYTAKFVDDISVYEINDLEDDTLLSLNYGYGITSKIDFINTDSSRTPIKIFLSDFINENGNVLLSNEYTQLILPIDVESSTIDEFGANLVLSGIINEETQPLISINISQNDERIIIPMSILLQKYINGQYVNYDGFELSVDGSKYNFSNIILMNNAYLEIVHSQ